MRKLTVCSVQTSCSSLHNVVAFFVAQDRPVVLKQSSYGNERIFNRDRRVHRETCMYAHILLPVFAWSYRTRPLSSHWTT